MDLITTQSSDHKRFLRLSSSPASSPRVVPAPVSPTRSVHLERHSEQSFDSSAPMTTKITQKDADFFDDASSDGSDGEGVGLYSPGLAGVNVPNRRSRFEPKKGERPVSGISGTSSLGLGPTPLVAPRDMHRVAPARPAPPTEQDSLPPGFMKLTRTPMQSPGMESFLVTDLPSPTTANPSNEPIMTIPIQHSEKGTRFADWDPTNPVTTESYLDFEPSDTFIPPLPVTLSQTAIAAALNNATREQQILGVHTITMQALLGDAEGLVATSLRNSEVLDHQVSDLPFRLNPVTGRVMKRVNLVPPPIDVHSKNYVPEDIVRTPYPAGLRKEYRKMPSPLAVEFSIETPAEARVAVVLQSSSKSAPKRSAHVVLPPHIEMDRRNIQNASPGTKEKHFDSLDFDDTRLFKELSKAYQRIAGSLRFFSARSLRCIRVEAGHGSDACGCGCTCSRLLNRQLRHCCTSLMPYHSRQRSGSCSHNATQASSPTSPTGHNDRGLEHHAHGCSIPSSTPIFDQESTSAIIMTLYRNPKLGRSRYSWVNWIHKMAKPVPDGRVVPSPSRRNNPPPLPAKPTEVKVSVWEKRNSFSGFMDKTIFGAHHHRHHDKNKRLADIRKKQSGKIFSSSTDLDPPDSGSCSESGAAPSLTLVFVHGWSVPRILSAITIVLVSAILAALLWIFLGTSFLDAGTLKALAADTGYRGAGARVGEGMLVGGLVLGVGLSIVAGWIGVCWAVG